MYDSMGCKEIPHVYADRYESYKEFFPHDKLTQSKRYTSAIERIKDIGLRRFVDALLWLQNLWIIYINLFARFRINGTMDEILALAK